jgi:hypothetical protein
VCVQAGAWADGHAAAVTPPTVGRDRTTVDKLVDFITGDGPNNRYALICPHCKLHNGLVLPQDLATIRARLGARSCPGPLLTLCP